MGDRSWHARELKRLREENQWLRCELRIAYRRRRTEKDGATNEKKS